MEEHFLQIRKLFGSVANPIQVLLRGLEVLVPLGYLFLMFLCMDMGKLHCIKLWMLITRFGVPNITRDTS